jgi:hypothetical protein
MSLVAVNVKSHNNYYEIEVVATTAGFYEMADSIINHPSDKFALVKIPSDFYPASKENIVARYRSDSNGLISVQLSGSDLVFLGDKTAFSKLAEFIKSCNNIPVNGHFHLDWFSNEDLLTESNHSFVFSRVT